MKCPRIGVVFGMMTTALCASAQAECLQLEAQMIAQVRSVEAVDATTCAIGVSFDLPEASFHSSFVCPLDIDEVYSVPVLVKFNPYTGKCPYQVGDKVTGVVYRSIHGEDSRPYLE